MSDLVFLLALTVFNEDRSGDLTSHWAIVHTVLRRVDSPRWPDDMYEVLAQDSQFPWFNKNRGCGRGWTKKRGEAWARAVNHVRIIMANRKVSHKYACFHLREPEWAEGLDSTSYGPHNFYAC